MLAFWKLARSASFPLIQFDRSLAEVFDNWNFKSASTAGAKLCYREVSQWSVDFSVELMCLDVYLWGVRVVVAFRCRWARH
jgi:hypothetical protein